MKNIRCIVMITVCCSFLAADVYGQGCSDAGFCTINSFKPNSRQQLLNNQVKTGVFYGRADYDITVYGNYLEYNRRVNHKLGYDVKLTTMAQRGNGISVFGLSDLFVNATYKAGKNVNLTLGTKIPLSDGGRTQNNLPLPMDYQSSLGTVDLLFGIGYEIKKLQFVAAVQQPLTQNKNRFMAESYPAGSKLRSFQSTSNYQRKGDVLLRVSYPVQLHPKLRLTPGILPIYHLANDSYTDGQNMEKEIMGSRGLTVNSTVYLDYTINSKNSIQFSIGTPFITRDSRPDGLTRSVVVNAEYSIKF